MILFLPCACKYASHVNVKIKEHITGRYQRAIFPASSAIMSSCPKAFKTGVAKIKIGDSKDAVRAKTIHDL